MFMSKTQLAGKHTLSSNIANNVRVAQADRDKTMIIKLIAYGKTKQEIIETQDFSRTKVERVIRELKSQVTLQQKKEFVLYS